jgi:iron complex outermembrane receptor protein
LRAHHHLLATSAIICCSATVSFATAQVRQFDVAQQPASSGIPIFARQAGVEILVSGPIVDGVLVNRVRGSMEIPKALRLLLAGTDLVPIVNGSKIVLKRAEAPRRVVASATPVRRRPSPGQEASTAAPADVQIGDAAEPEQEIVVTGVRQSLERAAKIKEDAVQVVDAIVAQDIGKFPDPTTAAALQRVPGIQVQNDSNNELSGVRIRGLADIMTTVDGREVFTTTGRGFSLVDMPAEALARVEVFKSQTADQIEGGVAGGIDLKLNKPFNFKEPALVGSARQTYASRVGKANPALSLLATDRFDTGIGEIGVLVNGTWSHADSMRTTAFMDMRRSSGVAPLNTPGYLIPQVIQNMPDVGEVTRKQINGAIQWQASPSLQAYVDGFYTYFQTTAGFTGFNPQPFTNGTTMSNVVASDNCFDARVNANGTNPTISVDAQGRSVLQAFTVQRMCDVKSVQFNNIVINQNSSSLRFTQEAKQIAGGLRWEQDRANAVLDFGYQTSNSLRENVNLEAGQRVATMLLETDVDGGPRVTVPAGVPMSSVNLSLRNAFNQNFTQADGSLFQARADGDYEVGGLLKKVEIGIRFARREAVQRDVQSTTPIPYGNIGTGTEATARLISSLPLSSNIIGIIGELPRVNGGTSFVGIAPSYLRSESGRNELRKLLNLPLRQPDWNPTRQFDAKETTLASYVQGTYEVPLGGVTLDGVVGVRVIKTDRDISTFRSVSGAFVPVDVSTSDTDVLPTATARLKFPGGFQTRLAYSRSIRRPEFGDLNPTQSLAITVNPFQLSTGSAGNAELRPQRSDSIDATAEYYFKSGFVAITGYYRRIKDRVVTASSQETIDGINFLISRPRNVGEAELKGIETSAQYFFDFLPGDLAGLGVLGAFTIADSKIGGGDLLAGNALQGVSKYNFTIGGLYDRGKLSARVVYTYRSKYWNEDNSGGVQLRPHDPDRPVTGPYLPTLLSWIRPAGRLDFSVGLDVTDALRFDMGGTNVLRNETRQYRGASWLNSKVYGDETTYTLGARVRF